MIFMLVLSFCDPVAGNRVNSRADGPGRQGATDDPAVLQENQRLGRPAERQVEVQLVFLGVLQLSLRAGRTGRQDHHDTVGAEHVAEAHMDKALLIGSHANPSLRIPRMGLVGAARLELARLPAEVLETSVSANSTMLPHAAGIAASRRESHDHFVAGDPEVAGVVAGTRLAIHIGVGGLAFP